ncbi:MAG: response regulator [Calditrichota bacterium]
MIVEDEDISREVLAQALELMGYQTSTADNGLSALKRCEEVQPDLILSDIHMPEMNGLELLKELRLRNNKVPVILITGFDPEEARHTAQNCEATALILKPFRLQVLKKTIDDVLAGKPNRNGNRPPEQSDPKPDIF